MSRYGDNVYALLARVVHYLARRVVSDDYLFVDPAEEEVSVHAIQVLLRNML